MEGTIVNAMQQQGLTALELLELTRAVDIEERLVSLYSQGALECVHPQLRSFFAHQAERSDERLADLTRVLQSYAGIPHSGGWA